MQVAYCTVCAGSIYYTVCTSSMLHCVCKRHTILCAQAAYYTAQVAYYTVCTMAYYTVCIYYVYIWHTILCAQVSYSAVCVDGILYYVYMWHLFLRTRVAYCSVCLRHIQYCMQGWYALLCALMVCCTVYMNGMLYRVHKQHTVLCTWIACFTLWVGYYRMTSSDMPFGDHEWSSCGTPVIVLVLLQLSHGVQQNRNWAYNSVSFPIQSPSDTLIENYFRMWKNLYLAFHLVSISCARISIVITSVASAWMRCKTSLVATVLKSLILSLLTF